MIRTSFLTFALVTATATSASAGGLAYLSRSGGGTACTLSAPCNLMFHALAAAGSGGEVICLDKGSYFGGNITNSVTISCGDGLWEAPIDHVQINAPAGSDVVIEGLVMDSAQSIGGIAMNIPGQGSVHLHRVRIGNHTSGTGHAVRVISTGGVTLHVSDSTFYNNAGSGIHVIPSGNGFANVHIRNVKFERNSNGLFIDGSASTVGVNVNVAASVFAENSGNGIGAFSTPGAAGVSVSVKDAQIVGNIGNGVAVLTSAPSGAGSVTVEIGSSMISGNVTGISASGAGQIRTFGNNQLRLNGNNGAFTGSVGLQ